MDNNTVDYMKKYFMFIGAFFISLLLISTVTAVPQTQSNSIMNLIDDIEENIEIIESEKLNNMIISIASVGIIELLIQLIMLIIEFVVEIVNLIQNIISLVNLIQNIINAISTLFQLIQDLIELIRNILNPSILTN